MIVGIITILVLLFSFVGLMFYKHERIIARENFKLTLANKPFYDKDIEAFEEKYKNLSAYIIPLYKVKNINIDMISCEKTNDKDNKTHDEITKIIYSKDEKDVLILLWYIKLGLHVEMYNNPLTFLKLRLTSNFKRVDEDDIAKNKAEKNQYEDLCLA